MADALLTAVHLNLKTIYANLYFSSDWNMVNIFSLLSLSADAVQN